MDEENKNEQKNPAFESLDVLISRWKDGTFSEIIDDWKWIFSYSARYKGAIAFYVILGIFSTSMGLVSSVASKYMIDIITGYETSKLWVMILIMVGSTIFSLAFSSIISRISTKLSIDINNDIQADIFDKIVDADWLSLNKYSLAVAEQVFQWRYPQPVQRGYRHGQQQCDQLASDDHNRGL